MDDLTPEQATELHDWLEPLFTVEDPRGKTILAQKRWWVSHIVRRRLEQEDITRGAVAEFRRAALRALEHPYILVEQDQDQRPNEWAEQVLLYYECAPATGGIRNAVIKAVVIPTPVLPDENLRGLATEILEDVKTWWLKTVMDTRRMHEPKKWADNPTIDRRNGVREPCVQVAGSQTVHPQVKKASRARQSEVGRRHKPARRAIGDLIDPAKKQEIVERFRSLDKA